MEAAQDSARFYFALSVHPVLTTQRKRKPVCPECTVCGSLHSGRTSVIELGKKCLCKSQNIVAVAAAAVSDDTPYFLAVVSKMAGAKNRVVHCAKNLVFAPAGSVVADAVGAGVA